MSDPDGHKMSFAGGVKMILEIDLPEDCTDCVFCEEAIYCSLLGGEPIYDNEDYGIGHRVGFCPFDNKESRAKMPENVRIVSE